MLFNFFKRNGTATSNSTDEPQPVACIKYVIMDNNTSPIVDVEIKDYDTESMKGLCQILDTLASNRLLIETVEIIKNGMISEGQADQLITIFSHLEKRTREKMIKGYDVSDEETPCIKPSEAFITK